MSDLRLFDPKTDFAVIERRLPHWAQAGTMCFLTYRTADSMPKEVLQRWKRERELLLQRHQIDPSEDWKLALGRLPPKVAAALRRQIAEKFDRHLDECHGAAVLKRTDLAAIVAENLRHADGVDYCLSDFVVMPNHVHVMAAFRSESEMLPRIESWKRYQARRINAALKQSGHFWQADGFDHLVRSIDEFDHYRRYIADNPRVANLRVGEFVHYSKPL